jgi:hypothetical protein
MKRSTHWLAENSATFWSGNLKGGDNLEDIDASEWIILKGISNK